MIDIAYLPWASLMSSRHSARNLHIVRAAKGVELGGQVMQLAGYWPSEAEAVASGRICSGWGPVWYWSNWPFTERAALRGG